LTAKERRRTGNANLAASEHRVVAVRQGFLEEGGAAEYGRGQSGRMRRGIRPEEGRTSQTLN